jgi:hypothetical protein
MTTKNKEQLTKLVFKEVDSYLDTFANQVNEVEKKRLTENIVNKLLLHVVSKSFTAEQIADALVKDFIKIEEAIAFFDSLK